MEAIARQQASRAPVFLEDCDKGKVESALAAPRAGFGDREVYGGLASKAAALTYSVVKAHACTDGNKRTAVLLLVAFLGLNDSALEADDEELSDKMRGVAGSDAADRDPVIQDFAAWLETVIIVRGDEG